MQTTMQAQLHFNPIQTRTNTPYGDAWSQPSRTSPFDSGRAQSSPMSNMANGFSKTSYAVHGQTTVNGQTSSYFTKTTTISRGPIGQPSPAGCGRNAPQGGHDRYGDYSRGGNGTSRGSSCGCNERSRTDQTQWTNTPVANNKTSIDLGDYKLDFSKANSSMLLTNKKTGDTTNIYGDPHIEQHANSANKTSAMFNGPMTFMLPDNTKISVGTQAAKNNPSVTFADQVTITKGNQAYQVSGLSQQDSKALSVQKSNNGRALDAATPDGYTIVAARNGSGFIDPTTGKQPSADDFRKAA
ncbi:DUF1521 domain-containing protein [Paraburkholderia bryophila]|uniref:Uncharacterized protein DUF1521 n=1 Tax=Paraburkholderia bryophila TaxID=420952 RepID=A0A329BJR8_9BURK|nr:DUF1521 domain-containing protein [Paraburkholderia bryophila]RAS21521.1 uncharacterized protein DUF1521 [Paraburkholderia bryophila]